jgi:hypothetical protein
MNKATFGFRLSTHAIARLYERHARIFANPLQTGKARVDSAYSVLDDAVEHKAVNNHTAFMTYVHENYGFNKHRFFINGDVLFIAHEDSQGNKVIITTLSCNEHSVPHLHNATEKFEHRVFKVPVPKRKDYRDLSSKLGFSRIGLGNI